MSRKLKSLGLLCTLVCAAVGAWAVVSSRDDPAPAPTPAKPLPVLSVSVVAAPQKTVDDEIRVVGTVVPRENVMVTSELAGLRVRAVYAEVGDYVRRGQPLALLDGEGLSIDTQGMQTEYERTRDEYDRSKDMLAMGIVSKECGRQRQAAAEVARAKLRAAQLNVHKTQIVAPTDGLIYERIA